MSQLQDSSIVIDRITGAAHLSISEKALLTDIVAIARSKPNVLMLVTPSGVIGSVGDIRGVISSKQILNAIADSTQMFTDAYQAGAHR